MRRSDAAAAALPRHETSLGATNARRTLQVVPGLQDVCPSEVAGGASASDASTSLRAGVELGVNLASTGHRKLGPIDTASYRVSVTFTIAADELEEFVSAHLCHPRSTDVRIEAVNRGR